MMKYFMRHREIALMSLAAFLFSAGGTLWCYLSLRGVANTPLILHFDDLSGITAVGGLRALTAIGILGSLFTVINFFLAVELDLRDRFLGKLIAILTLIFAILLFLAFSAIINVN